MKYYFLSGIPRAGNTILSSILNQNNDICVSANSIITEILYKLDEWKKSDIAFNNFPVRNSEDVFCSWIDWCNKNPDNYINNATNNGTIEEKFNYLINPHSQTVQSVLSVNTLIQGDPNGEHHIIIDYDDIIHDPDKEVNRIYKFLDIPQYTHNYTKIEQFSVNGTKYDDSNLGRNLHAIRSKGILKRSYHVDVPQYLIDKCKNLNVWKVN